MIVCLCHPTSDRDLDAIIDDGARTLEEISARCGAGTGCGACVGEISERLQAKGAVSCSRDCAQESAEMTDHRSDLISPDLLALRSR